jgi:hypothetical protein
MLKLDCGVDEMDELAEPEAEAEANEESGESTCCCSLLAGRAAPRILGEVFRCIGRDRREGGSVGKVDDNDGNVTGSAGDGGTKRGEEDKGHR